MSAVHVQMYYSHFAFYADQMNVAFIMNCPVQDGC